MMLSIARSLFNAITRSTIKPQLSPCTNITNSASVIQQQPTRNLVTLLTSPVSLGRSFLSPSNLVNSTTPLRTHIRIHFPRAREHMRIRKHGWKKRISTPDGRKIIMRRIIKGRYVLTH